MLLRRLPLLVLLVPIRRRLPVRLLARCLLLLLLHLHLQLLLLLLLQCLHRGLLLLLLPQERGLRLRLLLRLRLRLLHLEPLGHCHATVCCSWLHCLPKCAGVPALRN